MSAHARLIRLIALALATGAAALVALIVAILIDHRNETRLPAPTGPYAVGRVTLDWRAPDTRELLAWIWYPAPSSAPATADAYLPPPMLGAVKRARANLMGAVLTRDLARVRDNVLRNAPVAPGARRWPVLIMRGGASAEVWNYSTLAEDLASHGYVVVGFDAPYRTGIVVFPDGRTYRRLPQNNPELVFGAPDSAQRITRILDAWTSDIGVAVDRLAQLDTTTGSPFAGRLDLTRVGLFGHSLGGIEVAQFCHADARCLAGVDIDGAPVGSVTRTGIGRPFMFLLSGHANETDPESQRVMSDIRRLYESLPPSGRALVEIRGANHFLFSDDGALLKSHVLMRVLRAVGLVRISGVRQLGITSWCLRRFFDATLNGRGVTSNDLVSPAYAELRPLD